MLKKVQVFIFIFLFHASYSKDSVNVSLLDYSKKCTSEYSLDIHKLVNYLKKGGKTEEETAELFYYWITENIEYDTKGLVYGTYNHRKTNILFTRKGVCWEYADLYKRMCDIAGIKCYIIHGYAKGYDYQEGQKFNESNHDWNIIVIDNKEYFMDVTWGAGSVRTVRGKLTFVKEREMKYFLSSPDYFALKHLPEDPRWQLRTKPISLHLFLQKTNVKEMVIAKTNDYNYKDSILVFEHADTTQRKILSANAAYVFNPSPENASTLASVYEHLAYDLSVAAFDENDLKLSIKYYKQAIDYYKKDESTFSNNAIEHSKKSIEYCKFRLKEKK